LNIQKHHFRMKATTLKTLGNGVLYAFEQPSRNAHIEDERFMLTTDDSNQRIIKFRFGSAIFLMISSMVSIMLLWYLTYNFGENNKKKGIINKLTL